MTIADLKQNLEIINEKLFDLVRLGKEVPQQLRDRKTKVIEQIKEIERNKQHRSATL